jgi:hypothetical protein
MCCNSMIDNVIPFFVFFCSKGSLIISEVLHEITDFFLQTKEIAYDKLFSICARILSYLKPRVLADTLGLP